jgi:putative pyoverdin transport system ATP-binding/permease protein
MNVIKFILKSSWLNILMATVSGVISGMATARIITQVNQAVDSQANLLQVLAYFGLVLLALGTGMISQFVLITLSQKAIYQLRIKISRNILASPLQHLENLGENRLLATLTDDVRMLTHAVAAIPSICIELATIIGCLTYLVLLSDQVFIVTIAIATLAIWGIQIAINQAQKLLMIARQEEDNLFKSFHAITTGTKELKLHQPRREDFFSQQLETSAKIVRQKNINSMQIFALADGLGQFSLFAILGFTLFFLPKLIDVSTATLASYALTITYLALPFQNLLHRLPDILRGNVALRKIESMKLALASETELGLANAHLVNQTSSIKLDRVTYNYHHQGEDNQFQLGEINLDLEPGKLTFLVGGNGSGKSTLAKLITGLYRPSTGAIYLNGMEITSNNQEWYRQHFSAIFADFYLFDRFLGIDLQHLDREAQRYLKLLQLDHKVKINDGVLSTTRLSQGQRKRLALLTAYLEDRPIYLFDEWAADQDPIFRDFFYTELLVKLKAKGKTILVISHDDRYFHLADEIIKLDYGQIISNSPLTLSNTSGKR